MVLKPASSQISDLNCAIVHCTLIAYYKFLICINMVYYKKEAAFNSKNAISHISPFSFLLFSSTSFRLLDDRMKLWWRQPLVNSLHKYL